MDKNVYAAIQSQYATFSKVGKRIADHIIADPVHITSISIQQMAAELGIAESSIIRFCKILGCTGFSEMKLLLAKYSPKSVRTIFEDLSETDSIQTISESVFGRNIDTLERALQLLDFQKIEQAVDVLSRAENILILGVGASGTIAEDFYIRLMRIGFRAVSLTDSHLMQIQASLCMPNTAVIAISHTGKTCEIVSAVRTAKEHGAQTIGITGFPDTPLKQVCDICLELYSPEQDFRLYTARLEWIYFALHAASKIFMNILNPSCCYSSRSFLRSSLDVSPTRRCTSCPPLKIKRVGMLITLNCCASPISWSTSILPTL